MTYKPNQRQTRISDTINRIGQRVLMGYTADRKDAAVKALLTAYTEQFSKDEYNPVIRVTKGREHEVKVYIHLPKIGTFKPSFDIKEKVAV